MFEGDLNWYWDATGLTHVCGIDVEWQVVELILRLCLALLVVSLIGRGIH